MCLWAVFNVPLYILKDKPFQAFMWPQPNSQQMRENTHKNTNHTKKLTKVKKNHAKLHKKKPERTDPS